MSHPVLAAQLYTVRDFTKTADDLAASLKKVKEIGYTAVQVSAIGPIPDAEVKKMVDDLGLKIIITHTAYPKLWNETDAVIAPAQAVGLPQRRHRQHAGGVSRGRRGGLPPLRR